MKRWTLVADWKRSGWGGGRDWDPLESARIAKKKGGGAVLAEG